MTADRILGHLLELVREYNCLCPYRWVYSLDAVIEDFQTLAAAGYDMEILSRKERCGVCPTCIYEGTCFLTFPSLRAKLSELYGEDSDSDLE